MPYLKFKVKKRTGMKVYFFGSGTQPQGKLVKEASIDAGRCLIDQIDVFFGYVGGARFSELKVFHPFGRAFHERLGQIAERVGLVTFETFHVEPAIPVQIIRPSLVVVVRDGR